MEPNSAPLRAFSLLGAADKWRGAGYLASSAAPPRRWRSSLETSECPRSCSSQVPKGGRMIVFFKFDVWRVLKRPHWVPQLRGEERHLGPGWFRVSRIQPFRNKAKSVPCAPGVPGFTLAHKPPSLEAWTHLCPRPDAGLSSLHRWQVGLEGRAGQITFQSVASPACLKRDACHPGGACGVASSPCQMGKLRPRGVSPGAEQRRGL